MHFLWQMNCIFSSFCTNHSTLPRKAQPPFPRLLTAVKCQLLRAMLEPHIMASLKGRPSAQTWKTCIWEWVGLGRLQQLCSIFHKYCHFLNSNQVFPPRPDNCLGKQVLTSMPARTITRTFLFSLHFSVRVNPPCPHWLSG